MAESILEQLAQWHLAMIGSITTANGYQQTLAASRSMELGEGGLPRTDLTAVCELGPVVKVGQTLDAEGPVTTWRQEFEAFVAILGRGSVGVPEDQRITRIVADIHKRIGVELAAGQAAGGVYCSGLAEAIELLPWEIGILAGDQGNCTIVNVPIQVQYEVLTRDPYTQP